MKQTILNTLIALLLLTIFTACGLPPQAVKNQSNQRSTQPTETDISVAEKFAQKVDLLLEQQAYTEAISYSTSGLRQNQAEPFVKGLVKAINAGLNQSELLIQSGNFEKAAQLLKAIKDGYPSAVETQQQLSKSSAQVEKDFNLSTQKMMDVGLAAYRDGDFSTAIDIWEKILAIDPHHLAAQNSLQTTRIQLSKLRNLNDKN